MEERIARLERQAELLTETLESSIEAQRNMIEAQRSMHRVLLRIVRRVLSNAELEVFEREYEAPRQ